MELQGLDAKRVYMEMARADDAAAGQPEPDGGYVWKGVLGGFLPRLGERKFSPGRTNKTFTHKTTSASVVSIVERGWAAWVQGGGVPLTKEAWARVSPHNQLRGNSEADENELKDLLRRGEEATEDLLFIQLLEDSIPSDTAEDVSFQYTTMQYLAIQNDRDELSDRVDEWHSAYPSTPQSQSGTTITGFESKVALAITEKETMERLALVQKAKEEYAQLLGRIKHGPDLLVAPAPDKPVRTTSEVIKILCGEHEEFVARWKLQGYMSTYA